MVTSKDLEDLIESKELEHFLKSFSIMIAQDLLLGEGRESV